jgi:hypothetical protein
MPVEVVGNPDGPIGEQVPPDEAEVVGELWAMNSERDLLQPLGEQFVDRGVGSGALAGFPKTLSDLVRPLGFEPRTCGLRAIPLS